MASSTQVRIVDRRGDQNVPKRYLKAARWNPEDDVSDLSLGPGYYVINPDEGKDDWIPVDFDFDALQWGLTYQRATDNKFEIYRPAPIDHGLRIYGEERTWDRSQWGPIDGTTDPEEGISFRFGSNNNTPEPDSEDFPVPTIDQAEKLDSAIADLAAILPSFIDKPRIPTNPHPASLMGTMAQIAATTTLTSTLARTTGPTISPRAGTSAGGIWDSLKNDLTGGAKGKGKDPNPPGRDPAGGSGGGGDPPDGGNPGGGGNPGEGPVNNDRGGDRLIGKEPEIFDGDRAKVEGFITKWKIYYGLNRQAQTMRSPFERTFLFLGYIRGPLVDKWVDDQIQDVYRYIQGNVDPNANQHEHIWDHMINDFAQTYQDIMSAERADAELNTLKMEKLCKDYFRGLPVGLQKTMVQMEPIQRYTELSDWHEGAIRHHRKFLTFQAYFGNPNSGNKNNPPRRPSKQQWQQGFAKDPNAMDTSAGRTRARAALTKDERGRLMKGGRCFNCKNTGHRSKECPDKKNRTQIRTGETKEDPEDKEEPASAVKASATKPLSAKEVIDLVQNMEEDEKEKVIEECFMKDFA